MELGNLQPAKGAVKSANKRLGRGQGSGTGEHQHVVTKEQISFRLLQKNWFEGGQMPLQRRVPKFGFTNINRKEYQGINLDTLQQLVDDKKVKEIALAQFVDLRLAGKMI